MSLFTARKNQLVDVAARQGKMKKKRNHRVDIKYQNVIKPSVATVVCSLDTSPATVQMQRYVSIVERVDTRETPVQTRIRM